MICKNMGFNSQVCTTKAQSELLLALGLKKETADCNVMLTIRGERYHIGFDMCRYRDYYSRYGREHNYQPAWSLHRLIEMLNNTQFGMTIGIYRDEVTFAEDLFEVYDNTYDNLISVIEWLIGLGKFNKEYLTQ